MRYAQDFGFTLGLGPQLQVAQWPTELLGLVMKGLVVLAMREEEQVLMVVVRLEEGVEQVEKVVPPSSFS